MKMVERRMKIAILSSYTIKNVEPFLFSALKQKELRPEIRLGGYDQYNQDLRSEWLQKWNPDFILIALSVQTIFPEILQKTFSDWSSAKKELFEKLDPLLESLEFAPPSSKIILTTLDTPSHSPFGYLDFQRDDSVSALVREANDLLRSHVKKHSNILLLDFERILSLIGKENAIDEKLFYIGKLFLSRRAAERLAEEVGNLIAASLGMVKKCIIVDLDNTLWYGIIGEDGIDGIEFHETTIGEIYQDVQKTLLLLKKTGILLAVVSKNNEEDVLPVFEKKGMVLRKDDFIAMRINWKPKSENITSIAEELNLGLDSFIFLDDNPTERLEVSASLPMVEVFDFPKDVSRLPKLLLAYSGFKKLALTEEDKKRHEMYVQEKQRKELQSSKKDYLTELGVRIKVSFNDHSSLERITQLINKTNQFNLRTQRYTKEQVATFIGSDDYLVSSVRVWDKFGELGLTGVIIIERKGAEVFIDTFLMSCRVLSRGIEQQFFLEVMKQLDGKTVHGEFIKTPKNKLVADFYDSLGFTLLSEENGVKTYELKKLDLKDVKWIEVLS